MNTQTQEALKMAIEALNQACGITPRDAHFCKAIQACKEALEQPAQEPVIIGIDFAQNMWKVKMIEFLKEKQILSFDNNKIIIQSWIQELEKENE